jgi:hypothetical protein
MHPKHSRVELGLDLVGRGLEGQRDRTAEGPIAALDNVPILVGVLFTAFGLLSPRMVSNPLVRVSSISFSSTPGNSAATSIASLSRHIDFWPREGARLRAEGEWRTTGELLEHLLNVAKQRAQCRLAATKEGQKI